MACVRQICSFYSLVILPVRVHARVAHHEARRGFRSCAGRLLRPWRFAGSPDTSVPGSGSGRTKRPAQVRLATRSPGFWGSPRIRAAPQRGCSPATRRIGATVSPRRGGRPGRGRDSRRQRARNPARCRRSSVSGRLRSEASRHARTRPASRIRNARSARTMAGRTPPRRGTSSCWRGRAFSASRCARRRATSVPAPVACVIAGGRAGRHARGARHSPARITSSRRRQRPMRPNGVRLSDDAHELPRRGATCLAAVYPLSRLRRMDNEPGQGGNGPNMAANRRGSTRMRPFPRVPSLRQNLQHQLCGRPRIMWRGLICVPQALAGRVPLSEN